MQSVPESKPADPSGGGGSTSKGISLRDCRSQIHPCELLHDHPTGSGRVRVHEEPGEFGTSGLTGAGRALFMADGTLTEKDWKLSDLTSILKTAARLVTWEIDGRLMVMAEPKVRVFTSAALRWKTAYFRFATRTFLLLWHVH